MYKKLIGIIKSPVLVPIWKWSKKSHVPVFIICILNLLKTGCSLGITVATKGLIDGAADRAVRKIWFYGVLLVCMVVLIQVFVLLADFLNMKTKAVLLKDMRTMFFERLLKKQCAYLNGYHSGELVNRMFSDVSVVGNGMIEILPGLVSMAVSFAGASILLISMDWRFVMVLILSACFGLGLALVFRRPMKRRHKAVQEAEGRLHGILQETLENVRLIKASGSEARMERQAAVYQKEFLEAQMKKGTFSVGTSSSIHVVFQFSWLFCMLWGCLGIYKGNLTYGMLAAIIQLVGQIQGPIASAAGIVGQAYAAISSAERLQEILELPEEEESGCIDGKELYEELTEIKICEMTFSYGRETEPVLEHVNVSINPGDFVAVTGISGGGKSTLFQLLLGIYQPMEGDVKFCFKNREEAASGRTRALFAYVPQGNTLFSGTLRENLTMFTDAATEEEIWQAAKTACIDQLILELDAGLNTVIGERGIGLSEGQAQRVAVARALLSQAPILLLDESTSALDEKTEARLLQNIASLKNKTCLIVTHRKAALHICHYQIHIEKAKAYILL
ncbi:MAG: ABC transporter ATP-binding protein [Blautia sp.]